MIEYEVLHYTGNVTGSDDVQPGRLLGANELDVPWVVVDAEFHEVDWLTTVHLKTAEPEEIRAAFARFVEDQANQAQLPPVFRPPVAQLDDGRVWLAPEGTPAP